MMQKREPSKWIFSRELKDCKIIEELEPEEKGKPYVVTPLGTRVKRVMLTGTVTQKFPDENLTKITVSDAVGSFYVSVFQSEFRQEQKAEIDSLEVNDTVFIMGRINPFKTAEGAMYFNINPEFNGKKSQETVDFWNLKTKYIARRKLYAIREALKNPESNEKSLTQLGYTKEEAQSAIRAREKYPEYDFQNFEQLILSSSAKRPESHETEFKQVVLDYVKNNDTDGKGCRYEDLVIASSNLGIDQNKVDELLNTLGSEGDIYEVSLKRYKAI
jgi:RPA family protein